MSSIGSVQLPSGGLTAAGQGHPVWSNRHQWQAIAQDARRTLGGTFHLDEAQLSGGRSIVLELTDSCWLTPATAQALQALAEAPGSHTLVLDEYSLTTTVAFDHSQGAAVQLEPLMPFAGDFDWYVGTIRLLEIA